MDNKTTPQLDPKLKEAYDRVMGTVVTPQPTPTPPTPQGATLTHEQPVNNPNPTMTTSPSSEKEAVKVKKKGKISPLIIFLGIVVFLAVYALVWIKVFGLKVPLLNP